MAKVIERRMKKMDEMIQETYEEEVYYHQAGDRPALADRIQELEQRSRALSREALGRNGEAHRQSYEVWSMAFVLRAVEATLDGNRTQRQEALDRALILYQAAQLPKDAGEYEMESETI